MKLPEIITRLLESQRTFDSVSFANCFVEDAIVFDESKTYTGKIEIENWNKKTNHDYHTELMPISYAENDHILSVQVSGTFPGSPIILNYMFEFEKGNIKTLRIE